MPSQAATEMACGHKLSDRFDVVKKSAARQSLSVGDGIAVLVLTLFIFAWIAGFIATIDSDPNEKTDSGTELFMFLAIFGPPIWAGGLVTYIIGKTD